jgi:hypothetical protein
MDGDALTMDQDQVALARLVRLPHEYHERGDASIVDLAAELNAGKWVENGAISPGSIGSHLVCDRSLVSLWLNWSADKRCSEGVFFIQEQDDFVVAQQRSGVRFDEQRYKDEEEACADFIFRELLSWMA